MSSMPTDNLTNESTTPVFSFNFRNRRCVMLAGCPHKDSTPPKLSANVKNLALDTNLTKGFQFIFFQIKRNHSAKIIHLRFGYVMIWMIS